MINLLGTFKFDMRHCFWGNKTAEVHGISNRSAIGSFSMSVIEMFENNEGSSLLLIDFLYM